MMLGVFEEEREGESQRTFWGFSRSQQRRGSKGGRDERQRWGETAKGERSARTGSLSFGVSFKYTFILPSPAVVDTPPIGTPTLHQ